MEFVSVQNLTRYFAAVKALDEVSFKLEAGKIYGFIGPNGAGKTTLLRILAGLDAADSGEIIIDGDDVSDYPEKLLKKSLLMSDTLPDRADIKVWEYIDFYARAAGMDAAARQEALASAMQTTHLEPMLNKSLCDLSKGMKQQLALARMLIKLPEIVLMDEPTAGLDPRARIEFRQTLLDIASEKRTVLISSHILSELEDMVHEIILIDHGRIIRSGTVEAAAAAGRARKPDLCRATLNLSVDAATVIASVQEMECIESAVICAPRQLLVVFKGGESSYQQAMAKLFASGVPICGVTRPDQTLEGIFMDATAGCSEVQK